MSATRDSSSPKPCKTIARLSFWLPVDREAEFEDVYIQRVVPLLTKHGLVDSMNCERPTPKGTFSRFFRIETTGELERRHQALQGDPCWHTLLGDLGTSFGSTADDHKIKWCLRMCLAPAGPGRVEPAGVRTGHWRTYDATDGLAGVGVQSILQDRDGYLWFGTHGGASRFDGGVFVNYNSRDDLSGNYVTSIVQDDRGRIWFTTGYSDDGVCYLDEERFVKYTAEDGLAHNSVLSMIQSRDGSLWFGTGDHLDWDRGWGASRFDGNAFTSLTVEDGLAGNRVASIHQARDGYLWFGTNNGASCYDGQSFTNYVLTAHGLGEGEGRD